LCFDHQSFHFSLNEDELESGDEDELESGDEDELEWGTEVGGG
jgi:hypothetical protein